MSLIPSIARLRELSPSLNKASDEATRVVQEVETLLTKKLGLGIEAAVDVCVINKTAKKTEYTRLAHCRVGGKFRIAVVVERSTDFVNDGNYPETAWDTVSETPWLECPRDVKLETFSALPKLLEALIAKAEKATEGAAESLKAVESLIGKPKK